jgi:hypothetical protein
MAAAAMKAADKDGKADWLSGLGVTLGMQAARWLSIAFEY